MAKRICRLYASTTGIKHSLKHGLKYNAAKMPHNQTCKEANGRKRTKVPIKMPNYTSVNIWTVIWTSGFPWRKDCFSTITETTCQWSPCNIKSLLACNDKEVTSQAFLESPEIKSWRWVKTSTKQQRSHHLSSTSHFPVTELAPNTFQQSPRSYDADRWVL